VAFGWVVAVEDVGNDSVVEYKYVYGMYVVLGNV
jgi:hypothetical protein